MEIEDAAPDPASHDFGMTRHGLGYLAATEEQYFSLSERTDRDSNPDVMATFPLDIFLAR